MSNPTTVVTNTTQQQLSTLTNAIDVAWILFAGTLVFLMQAGFTLLEAGFVRKKNTQSILMKNIIDCAAGAIGWFLLGYGLAFGKDSWNETDGGGFLGTNKFFVLNEDLSPNSSTSSDSYHLNAKELAIFFFQWTFCATASTIVSGALAERCRLEGYVIISLLLSLVLYPIVVHWAWSGGWLSKKGYNDFAGSGVVHMFGGMVAITGAVILGPRIGRFDASVLDSGSSKTSRTIEPSSLLHVTIGTFILMFGWFGFNAGSTLGLSDGTNSVLAARCCATTMLSASSGGLVAFAISSSQQGKYDVASFANGILAGLVGITAGCYNVDLHISVLIGIISGVVVEGSSKVLEGFEIDDAVGAFPVHGACGIWGVLAAGLFDLDKGWWSTSTGFSDSLGPNILGILSISAWAVFTTAPCFFALKKLGLLRVSEEIERKGLDTFEFAYSISKASAPDLYQGTTEDLKIEGIAEEIYHETVMAKKEVEVGTVV